MRQREIAGYVQKKWQQKHHFVTYMTMFSSVPATGVYYIAYLAYIYLFSVKYMHNKNKWL